MNSHGSQQVDVEASHLLPEIRPRLWPVLAGGGFAAVTVVAAALIPVGSSFLGEVHSVDNGQCVLLAAEDDSEHDATLDATEMDIVQTDEQLEIRGCESESLQVGEVVQVEASTSLAEMLTDAAVEEGSPQ